VADTSLIRKVIILVWEKFPGINWKIMQNEKE
jgi:hypothetical protein